MSTIHFRTQICYGTQCFEPNLWEQTLAAADSYLDPLFGDGTKVYATDRFINGNRGVVRYSELPSQLTWTTVCMEYAIDSAKRHGLPFDEVALRNAIAKGQV